MHFERSGVFRMSVHVALLLLVFLLAGCRTVSLPDSEPPAISVSAQKAQTRRAILKGISDAGWTVHREQERTIFARVDVRKHMLIVRIDYDDEVAKISYHDSENLLCKEQGATCSRIHRKYPAWVNRLSRHIIERLDQQS